MPGIRRKSVLKDLPNYNWNREEQTWKDRLITKDKQAELPIAYYEAQLEDMGCTIHYKSKKFGEQGTLIKAPNIIFSDIPDLISNTPSEWKDRFDAVGIIHASLPDVPLDGDPAEIDTTSPLWIFLGIPSYQSEDFDARLLRDKLTFIGGRIYVVLGPGIYPGNYIEGDPKPIQTVGVATVFCNNYLDPNGNQYNIPSDPQCHGGNIIQENYQEWPDLEEDLLKRSATTDIEEFLEYMERFDKYKVCAWFDPDEYDIKINLKCVAGAFVGDPPCESHDPYVWDEATESYQIASQVVVPGSIAGTQAKNVFTNAWSGFPPERGLILDDNPGSKYVYLADALIMFESA